MSSTTIVSFALVLVILGIHVMHACPLSTGLCKQYGHSCLGGHGKRAEVQPSRLMKHIFREMSHLPMKEADMLPQDFAESADFWENIFNNKADAFENDEQKELRANLFD
ncbi:uncharacterized protein LOC118187970 [Stegodyphus dumicola]|uniref:uncharacterized protein LOC118187970 n=1 Tax=Stegodyphus dumicola TaxID=202533 RepID=UPI0015AACAFF|nr:uncharacterized protein LOC118187970 [Stegodyphus dumicola]